MTPTQSYRPLDHREPKPLLKGLDAAVNQWIGRFERRKKVLDDLRADAEEIDRLAAGVASLSDHVLRDRLAEYRAVFRRGGRGQEQALIPAFAAIREVAIRQIGLRPFLVQLMGALALHRGYLAEMATGEGKTLTSGLAGVVAGWSRRPCHVVTVNDYLVQRDSEWLEPIYRFCGLNVSFVTGPMSPEERRKGYHADITYVTSKEILADFLRDRLHVGAARNATRRLIRQMLSPQRRAEEGLVMRGLHTAIIDEADSVLIDEAVTPLIISAVQRNDALREVVRTADQMAGALQSGIHYQTDPRYREVELTAMGLEHLTENAALLPGFWRSGERRVELVRQSLLAREFYLLGKQYIISEGKVVIVDEFTGRPMPQRTWRQGMHQAIEAKEKLDISDPSETIARLSFQRFFRLYYRMSGMTGTAQEAADEFWQIYGLGVLPIPTNKPCIRAQWPDRIFVTEDQKWEAIASEIAAIHATGRPLLVGTRSVAASERLAASLTVRALNFQLLNAVRLLEEARIVAEAGVLGKVTIATNMAGRGTDIKLGRGVTEIGGLHVIATERHESHRVDRQLFGRSARQGDPGSAQAFWSIEDELFRRHLPARVRSQAQKALRVNAPLAPRVSKFALFWAQRNAQRQAFRQRRGVLKTDTWMDEALSFAGASGV